jgi:hypothetical protein
VSRLRRLAGRLRPRRLRLIGLGLSRTGTTSLAETFSTYRSEHEFAGVRMMPIATLVQAGVLAENAPLVQAELRRRDHRYRLDVDVAQFLTPFARTLADLHGDARFVLLVRDCFSWLDSRIEKSVRDGSEHAPLLGPWFNALYGPDGDRDAPEDAALRDAGLRPVASYLRAWSAVTDSVLRAIPADRLLVVRTEDLTTSLDRIAEFAGVPVSTLMPRHANQLHSRTGLLAHVPIDFVCARARAACSPLMERYWGPEWLQLADRISAPSCS